MNPKSAIEKQYLSNFRMYKKGKMSSFQFAEASKEMHCTETDGPLMRLGENAIWYRYENGQWVFHSYLTKERHRRKLNILAGVAKRHLALTIIAASVIVALAAGLVFPGSIASSYASLPGRYSGYTSPKIVSQLYDAVRVNAPKGALKREDQMFTASELSSAETDQLLEIMTPSIIPMYAFSFSGGLEEDETFRRNVAVEVDLSKTGIEKEFYPYLKAYRLHGDIFDEIPASLNRELLTLTVSRESITVVGLGIIGGVIAIGGAIVRGFQNREAFGGVTGSYIDYTGYKITGDKYKEYTIYYHDDLQRADIRSIKQREGALMNRNGFFWDTNLLTYKLTDPKATVQDEAKALRKVQRDPEFILLQEEFSKLPVPDALQNISDRIKKSHDYLTDVCGLTSPGCITFIIPAVWDDSDSTLAYENQQTTQSPFIKINPSTIKLASLPANEKAKLLDDLLVTLTHEMFHSVQRRYFNSNKFSSYWFSEATAALLEKDCASYYLSKNIISTYATVDTDYYHLLRNGTAVALPEVDERHLGYTLSNVLRYQREQTTLRSDVSKSNFLHMLMTQYNNDVSCDALYHVGIHADNLVTAYFKANDPALLSDPREPPPAVISKVRDALKIAEISEKPLSFGRYAVNINIAGLSTADLQNSALLLVVDEKNRSFLNSSNTNIFYSPDSSPSGGKMVWTELPDKSGICPADPKSLTLGFTACIINEKNDNTAETADFSAIVAPKPAKVLSIKYDKEMMRFEVELEPDSTAIGRLKRGRAVEVSVPGTSIELFRKYVKPGENKVEISVLELLSKGRKDSSLFEKWAGTLMSTAVKLNFQLMLASVKMQNKELFKAGDDPLTISLNNSYSFKNPYGITYNLSHEFLTHGMPTSIRLDIFTDDRFNAEFAGNNGMYLSFSSAISDYFKYFRFMNLNPKAGINYDELAKKLAEMDGTDVFFAVRDVYSLNEVISLDTAAAYENSFHKTSDIVLGPRSDEKSLLTSGLSFDRKAIPEGRYGGKFIFGIRNNIYDIVTAKRTEYRDIRIKDANDREIEDYIKENNPSAEQLEAEKKNIARRILEEEKEYEENFKTAMDELNKELNNIYYYLTVTSQKTATLAQEGVEGGYDCTITPTGKIGVYNLTVPLEDNPVTVRLVVTPNGELIAGCALAILTRQ